MRAWRFRLFGAAVAGMFLIGGRPSQGADLVVRPAVDGIVAAFDSHPLVGLAEQHGLAEEGDIYTAVVRNPVFAEKVGNVVVEFGGAAHQATLDRYLAGEDVPYAELRRVWIDVVGWVPTVGWSMYVDFFAQVRAANQRLPADRRIKVWLGEPPIDWSKIHSAADLRPYGDSRDPHVAALIEREILSKGKKALVIYGASHFDDFLLSPTGPKHWEALKEIVERKHPSAFFVVRSYAGFEDSGCSIAFEAKIKSWPRPALAAPVKGTWLEAALAPPGCSLLPPIPPPPPGVPPPQLTPEILAKMEDAMANRISRDGLLYLGPASRLTQTPWNPEIYLDEALFREISRRVEIMTGRPLDWGSFVRGSARAPQPYRP
jgi:hypothetical protein